MITKTGCSLFDGKTFVDGRGWFEEIYKESKFPDIKIKQWNMSESFKGVVRGMHFQTKNPQGKFVTVPHGEIVDVVVDLRLNSKTCGQMEQFILSQGKYLYIPPGFAHGFWNQWFTRSIVLYGVTEEWHQESDGGFSPLDETFNFPWKGLYTIMSDKDKKLPKLRDLGGVFK